MRKVLLIVSAAAALAGTSMAAEPSTSVNDFANAIKALRQGAAQSDAPVSLSKDAAVAPPAETNAASQVSACPPDLAPCESLNSPDRGLSITKAYERSNTQTAQKSDPVPMKPTPVGNTGASPPKSAPPLKVPVSFERREADLQINFPPNSSRLTAMAKVKAKTFAQALVQPGIEDTVFEIAGYTDASGSREKNIALSQARAEAVRQYLVEAGVPSDRLQAKGYGPDNLHYPNPTDPKNRMVQARLVR